MKEFPVVDVVNIEIISDGWECDDCGWITDTTLIVRKNGEVICEKTSDGHFGGGDIGDNEESRTVAILEALGYEVGYLERYVDEDG